MGVPQVGINLPRTSQEMARFAGGMLVPLWVLQPGDVITMDTYDIAGHVGIYAGDGMVFNAYGTGVPTGLRPAVGLPDPQHSPLLLKRRRGQRSTSVRTGASGVPVSNWVRYSSE